MPRTNDRWLRLNTEFLVHPKVRKLHELAGSDGVLFHLGAMLYCQQFETDGKIEATYLPLLAVYAAVDEPVAKALVKSCVDVKLWDAGPEGSWIIHNFTSYQYSAVQLEERRERDRDRKRRSRAEQDDRTFTVMEPMDTSGPHGVRDGRPRRTPAATEQNTGDRYISSKGEVPGRPRAREAPYPTRNSQGGCPSCGMPWGSGHLDDCDYDPRTWRPDPALTDPDEMGNDERLMAQAAERLRSLRDVIKSAPEVERDDDR